MKTSESQRMGGGLAVQVRGDGRARRAGQEWWRGLAVQVRGGGGGFAVQVRSGGRGSPCRSRAVAGLAVQVASGGGARRAGRGRWRACGAGRGWRRGLAVGGRRRCGVGVPVTGDAGSACRSLAMRPALRQREGSGPGPATARPSGHDCLGSSAGTEARRPSPEGSGNCGSVEVTGRNEIRPGSVGRAEGNCPDAGEYSAFFDRSFNGWQSARASVQGPSCAIA
jgi:hypothetical protein